MYDFVKLLERVHNFSFVFAKKSNSWEALPGITRAAQSRAGSNINSYGYKMRCPVYKDFSNSY